MKKHLFGLVTALLLAAFARPAFAQSVILNPGTIAGSIAVTGETVDAAYVYAYWTDPSSGTSYNASTYVSGSTTYSMIVNVPDGTSPNYVVYAYAYIDGYKQYMYLGQRTVVPVANDTVSADFSLVPAIITGTVTATAGTLTGGTIYSGSQYVGFGADGHYRLVVPPSNGVSAYGYAYDAYGNTQLPTQTVGDLVAGQEVDGIDWSVALPAQPPSGGIAGAITIAGPVSPTSLYVYASGPSFGSTYQTANGPYSMTSLYVGNYYMWGGASFGNSSLSFPSSVFSTGQYVQVNDGATTAQDVSANEAFITGTVTVNGTKTLADVSSAYISASGNSGNATSGSASFSLPVPGGAYSMVVTDGGWSIGYLGLNFSASDINGVQEYLNFYDYQASATPVTLAAGDSVTRNLTYSTGTVTVNFYALGGVTFSNPNLSGYCYKYGPMGETLSYYYFNAYNNYVSGATNGPVTFAGMEGHCSLTAFAYVNGGYTSFGAVDVDVVPGATKVIDIGGPSLALTFPEANYLTAAASLTVTGTATDAATGVASVVVNGVSATLTPTGNPLDMNEVAFSATIPLAKGPNTVQTVATGNADDLGTVKTASDSRIVYSDAAPPAIVWTPADGSTTGTANVTVAGTATDDAGIQSVTVNGVAAAVAGDGTFSMPLTLAVSPGDNFITVVVTDVSGQVTTQVHKVTVVLNAAPVAVNDAYTGTAGSPIVAGGSGVLANDSDSNGDPLSAVLDSGPAHGTLALNANGSFTYTPASGFSGADSFTYHAFDGMLASNTATVSITVSPAQACQGDDDDDDRDDRCDDDHHHDGAPKAKDDHYTYNLNSKKLDPPQSVLKNDRHAVSAVLVSGVSHGTLVFKADGTFTYKPASGFKGTDHFVYKAKNGAGQLSNAATVEINVVPKGNGHED